MYWNTVVMSPFTSPGRCAASASRISLLMVLLVVGLVASACAGVDDRPTLAFDDGEALIVAETTSAPPQTTVIPRATTTTTAPMESLPNETWVAVATPSIERLETFDAPNGEPVYFEFGIFNPTYWETPLALRIVEGVGSDEWVKVALPVRPNGSEAWIRTAGFETFSHQVHAEVIVSSRTVRVYDDTELIAETEAVVGTDATPTPVGDFYVNDLLPRENADGAYGPWIVSLSAFSEALETFSGGLPVIAIHGTNNPDLIGGAHSNGCIRIPNDVVTFLAENVPLGTPVRISA